MDPTISRRKPRLAFTKSTWDVNIWRLAIPVAAGRPTSSSKFAPSTYLEHMPQFSPDGLRVAFISNRSGSQQIWIAAADGSNPHKITSLDGPECGSARWSPDGERIVFHVEESAGQYAIYAIDGGGGTAHKIIDDGFAPDWSRDGNWMYFSSARTGADQVWKARLASGSVSALTQVTKNGGQGPQESADGRVVYYVRDQSVWQTPVDGGQEMRVTGPLGLQENFAVARSGIYFMSPQDKSGHWPVQLFGFADRKSKTIALIENYPEWGMTVSPDERWLLYPQLDAVEADLMVVENFR
jgi:Tol biopolymer transport system component